MLLSAVVREVETNHTDCCLLIELVVGRLGVGYRRESQSFRAEVV